MPKVTKLLSLAVGALLTLVAVPSLALGAIRPASGVVLSGPDVTREVQTADLAEPGWLKIQANWARLEPTPGAYDVPNTPESRALATLGRWLAEAKATGAKTQLIVNDAPAWASGQSNVRNDPPTPANVPRYAAFVQAIASRYGQHIDAYLPWNEPNIDLFWNPPDPVAYVNLQRAVYQAVKQVDPTAAVPSAPLAGSGGSYDYLTRAYQAGLGQWIDALSWNAYPPTTPEARLFENGRPQANTLGAQAEVGRIIDRFDPGQEVWIGEFGWSTCVGCLPDNSVSESVQAKYLPRAFLYFRRYAEKVTVTTWFKLLDGSPNKAIWEQNSGLVNFDRTPKPAFSAFANLEQRIRVTTKAMTLNLKVVKRRASGTSAIARPRVTYNWGQITLRMRIAVPKQGMYLLQGYKNGRWSRIQTGRLRGSSNATLRFDDSGQLAVRVLVRASGDPSWTVGRVLRLKGTLPPS